MAAEAAQIAPVRRALGGAARRALVRGMGMPTAGLRAWPDVIIIGAQRAGTTTLWRWLSAHPDFTPPVLGMKGVHWPDLHGARSATWYRGHFPLARDGRRTGEASPYYLFHPRAPQQLAATLPASTRFVVLLREPASRAVSHYHHMRDEGTEPLPTLEQALDAEAERLAGADARLLADPAAVDEHHLHHAYTARGEYATQLRRWFDAVGRERMLVLDGARLRSEPDALLAEVCRAIGLDPALASTPGSGVNAGRYDPPSATTTARLREHFAEHDDQLWDLLGTRFW